MLILGCAGQPTEGETQRPNLILTVSELQCFNDYRFIDHDIVRTPILDRMASQGLRNEPTN